MRTYEHPPINYHAYDKTTVLKMWLDIRGGRTLDDVHHEGIRSFIVYNTPLRSFDYIERRYIPGHEKMIEDLEALPIIIQENLTRQFV